MQGRILLSLVAAVLLVGLGHGLQCYDCPGACSKLLRKNVTCDAGQSCGITKYYAMNIDKAYLSKESCMNRSVCGTTRDEREDGILHQQVKVTCCDKDFCNAGISAKLSLLAGLAAVTVLWFST